MVFLWPTTNTPRLNAYLLKDLSEAELESFKKRFEFGTYAPFSTMLELVIKKAPEDYLDKPHSYIRAKETEAGRTEPFVLIDEQVALKDAVWYVADFASEDEVEDGEAESTAVLWQILVKTDTLPITYVNYDIGNMSIQEDLGNCGVDLPAQEGFAQPEVWDSGGLDIGDFRKSQDAWVTAEPGEFEVSTDEDKRGMFAPMPERVGRLNDDVASRIGVKSRWTIAQKAQPRKLPDGTTKEFPEGSVVLQVTYDPDFPWPPYKWPEGSL
ncbi:hypothetical protein F5Y05DRAFT_341302 [Hypoxylon sp. FL0543]|nr:hypothetical protein F5Y05DRAFT_341302 [Hypoxylon sp. FL0543]